MAEIWALPGYVRHHGQKQCVIGITANYVAVLDMRGTGLYVANKTDGALHTLPILKEDCECSDVFVIDYEEDVVAVVGEDDDCAVEVALAKPAVKRVSNKLRLKAAAGFGGYTVRIDTKAWKYGLYCGKKRVAVIKDASDVDQFVFDSTRLIVFPDQFIGDTRVFALDTGKEGKPLESPNPSSFLNYHDHILNVVPKGPASFYVFYTSPDASGYVHDLSSYFELELKGQEWVLGESRPLGAVGLDGRVAGARGEVAYVTKADQLLFFGGPKMEMAHTGHVCAPKLG